MFSVLQADGTVISHPRGSIRARPGECPDHPHKIEGFCVVFSDLEAVACLGSYPNGCSYHDCIAEGPECVGVEALRTSYREQSDETKRERQARLIGKAHAAAQEQKRVKEEKEKPGKKGGSSNGR